MNIRETHIDLYGRQKKLQAEEMILDNYLDLWETVLDIRKLTGWNDAKAREKLFFWARQGITFEEIVDSLKMGKEPRPPASDLML